MDGADLYSVGSQKLFNPSLYRRLWKAFGVKPKVMSREIPLVPQYRYRALRSRRQSHEPPLMSAREGQHGEAYLIPCPFCKDSKKRCSVSYRYDTLDDYGRPIHHLVKCFNEECFQENSDYYAAFYSMLERSPRAKRRKIRDDLVSSVLQAHVYKDPGVVSSLLDLPSDHAAVHYLEKKRRFSCDKLTHRFGIGYCKSSSFRLAAGRILIPVILDKKPYGWQARFIGSAKEADAAGVPKSYSMPGSWRASSLYNLDQATRNFSKTNAVVVCEGPPDVWRTGPSSVALFGNKATHWQLQTIVERFASGLVICLLDPSPSKQAQRGKAEHHSDVFVRQLQAKGAERVVDVRLKSMLDPGDSTVEDIWRQILQASRTAGFSVSAKAGLTWH